MLTCVRETLDDTFLATIGSTGEGIRQIGNPCTEYYIIF